MRSGCHQVVAVNGPLTKIHQGVGDPARCHALAEVMSRFSSRIAWRVYRGTPAISAQVEMKRIGRRALAEFKPGRRSGSRPFSATHIVLSLLKLEKSPLPATACTSRHPCREAVFQFVQVRRFCRFITSRSKGCGATRRCHRGDAHNDPAPWLHSHMLGGKGSCIDHRCFSSFGCCVPEYATVLDKV